MKKKGLTQLLAKGIVLTCLFMLTVFFLGDVLFLDKKISHKSWESFYNREKNSLDILFLGNSHLGSGLDLNIINAKNNANSHALIAPGKTLSQIYYTFLEALKYQKPKVLVIETYAIAEDSIYYFQNVVSESNIPFNAKVQSFDPKKLSALKYQEYKDLYKNQSIIKTFFPLFRNHSQWSRNEKINERLFSYFKPDTELKYFFGTKNAIQTLDSQEAEKYKITDFNKHEYKISKNQKEYFNKILDVSDANNIKVVLVTLPYFKEYRKRIDYGSFHKAMNTLAKSRSIEHIDLNYVFPELSSNYFTKEKVGHNQHLNYRGAILTSNYLANKWSKDERFKFQHQNQSLPEYYLYRSAFDKNRTLLGSVDLINNQKSKRVELNQNKFLMINGWAAVEGENANEGRLFIGLKKDNNFIFINREAHLKVKKRQDVAKRLKSEQLYLNSGFRFSINAKLLEKGEYEIYLFKRLENGNIHSKKVFKKIIIN